MGYFSYKPSGDARKKRQLGIYVSICALIMILGYFVFDFLTLSETGVIILLEALLVVAFWGIWMIYKFFRDTPMTDEQRTQAIAQLAATAVITTAIGNKLNKK
ncbi:MAG: hypothetical protein FWH57_11965 [Oscillospiraceae bacterium]|nr:hypothetical protein [Oscillospiraceae bacterium]